MKILKIISNCLFCVIAIVLVVTLCFAFVNRDSNVPTIGKHSVLVVKGTSMHPLIKEGDLIAINRKKQEKYDIGDIVSFVDEDGSLITHEIINIESYGNENRYYTKGVNNNYQDNDYIKIEQIIGEYKGFRIPLLGYFIGFASTEIGYTLLIIVPLGIVLAVITIELVKEISKKRGEI